MVLIEVIEFLKSRPGEMFTANMIIKKFPEFPWQSCYKSCRKLYKIKGIKAVVKIEKREYLGTNNIKQVQQQMRTYYGAEDENGK